MQRDEQPIEWALAADEWENEQLHAYASSGTRMRGEGNIADVIHQQFRIAKEKYLKDRKMPAYNLNLHEQYKSPQLKLF